MTYLISFIISPIYIKLLKKKENDCVFVTLVSTNTLYKEVERQIQN